jgi:hypothetical protein
VSSQANRFFQANPDITAVQAIAAAKDMHVLDTALVELENKYAGKTDVGSLEAKQKEYEALYAGLAPRDNGDGSITVFVGDRRLAATPDMIVKLRAMNLAMGEISDMVKGKAPPGEMPQQAIPAAPSSAPPGSGAPSVQRAVPPSTGMSEFTPGQRAAPAEAAKAQEQQFNEQWALLSTMPRVDALRELNAKRNSLPTPVYNMLLNRINSAR